MNNAVVDKQADQFAQRLAQLSPEKRELFQRQLATRRLRGPDLIARALHACGVTHIFAVAAEPTQEIIPACVTHGIRPIGVYHQTSAVCMALAHNFQSGRLDAVALVSAGPAATNAMTGLLNAHDNGWPVIVLGGRRSSFQRCDSVPLVNQVTKAVIDVPSTAALPDCIHQAYRIAVSGRPGPVYLDLHEDILHGRAVPSPVRDAETVSSVPQAPEIPDVDIDRVATALLSARRPAMLLGKGVRWTLMPDRLQELVDLLDLPFITSPMGRGFIADNHPRCFNQARTVLQSRADVVLILGARLNWMFRHGAELSPDARVFRIDIHRDDEDDAAIPTDFVHADAGDFVSRLLEHLKHRQDALSQPGRQKHIADWQDALHKASDATQRLLDQRMNDNSRPMSPFRMMKEIRDALPEDVICISEGNVSMRAAQAVIPALRPASRMDAGTNGCMGVGIPFAIGAKVACPDRPVVVIAGDFGFSLSAMEMEVCVRHRIPIVVVVANNQGNCGANRQRALFPEDHSELVTMFQPGIEYDHMMKMFGGQGKTVNDPEVLKAMLEDAIASGAPTCINVLIDPATSMPNAWGEQSTGPDVR